MTYEVRTPVFEGPLDLLLQLITSHRVEVTELSLQGPSYEAKAVKDGRRVNLTVDARTSSIRSTY